MRGLDKYSPPPAPCGPAVDQLRLRNPAQYEDHHRHDDRKSFHQGGTSGGAQALTVCPPCTLHSVPLIDRVVVFWICNRLILIWIQPYSLRTLIEIVNHFTTTELFLK